MVRIYWVSLLAVSLGVSGCQNAPTPCAPALPHAEMNVPPEATPEETGDGAIPLDKPVKTRVLENCLIVRDAVEAFAAANGGDYPHNLCDETPEGETVIDFLPEGTLLENPVYLCRTEPVDGSACIPGQTGYLSVFDSNHRPTGYLITGYGFHGNIVELCEEPTGECD